MSAHIPQQVLIYFTPVNLRSLTHTVEPIICVRLLPLIPVPLVIFCICCITFNWTLCTNCVFIVSNLTVHWELEWRSLASGPINCITLKASFSFISEDIFRSLMFFRGLHSASLLWLPVSQRDYVHSFSNSLTKYKATLYFLWTFF